MKTAFILLLASVASPSIPKPVQRLAEPSRSPAIVQRVQPVATGHILTWREYFKIELADAYQSREDARARGDKTAELHAQWDIYNLISILAGGNILRQDELDRPYTGPAF